MKKEITPAVRKIEESGITGANALWDGPLDVTGFPMGKGSSSGKDGLELSKYPCDYVRRDLSLKERWVAVSMVR
jgi:hypothetical protein